MQLSATTLLSVVGHCDTNSIAVERWNLKCGASINSPPPHSF